MQAHRSTAWEEAPEVVEAPNRTPGSGDVVVRPGADGVGRGDLHELHHWSSTALPWSWTLPLTLGQQVAAWAAEYEAEFEAFRADVHCQFTATLQLAGDLPSPPKGSATPSETGASGRLRRGRDVGRRKPKAKFQRKESRER